MKTTLQRPTMLIALAGAVALLLLVAAGAYYVFGSNGASPGTAPPAAGTLVATDGATLFTIDSASSEASFTIDEVLFGQPNTVVGKTSAVTGQIAVNTKDPSKSQVGQIRVDVSTLVTDNDLRNNTIRNRILETVDPSKQYAIFTVTSLSGLPSSVSVGQTVSFKMTGDLALHGTTRQVTFDATVTLKSASELEGQAQTTVKYSDFNISIPDVPSVTGVSDDVKLAITFTAKA